MPIHSLDKKGQPVKIPTQEKVGAVLRQSLKEWDFGTIHNLAVVYLDSEGNPVINSSVPKPKTIELLEQALAHVKGE